ncbi:hypothetical protein CARUB_v10002904mg, partial [Capsella rubella]
MIDVGNRNEPPRDPPDRRMTFAETVAIGHADGRLSPEELFGKTFVKEICRLEFPKGEDRESSRLGLRCIIVKVLSRNVALPVLTKRLREMWKPKGAKFLCCKLGSILMLQPWTPKFDPLVDEIVTTPMWIWLTNIPVNLYHKDILFLIACRLGNPLKVYFTTLNFERDRFACIYIEVNLKKPLKDTVLINGNRYFVAYEVLTNICPICRLVGDGNEGFTLVGRSGRRVTPPRVPVVAPVTSSQGILGRKLAEITNRNVNNDITISNRFGDLEMSPEDQAVQEDTTLARGNKESISLIFQSNKGRSVNHGTKKDSFGPVKRGQGPGRVGPKENRGGTHKGNIFVGQRAKSHIARPMIGLVFGPTRGEVEKSMARKIICVEREDVGRVGGVFES